MTEQEKIVYAAKAKVLKALSHPTRLWIAEKLAKDAECCVCELVDGIGADFSTVSKHLTVLKNAGILEDEKRGKQVFYRLRVPCILNFMDCVMEVIRRQIEDSKALVV